MSDERWANFWAAVGLIAFLALMVAAWLYLDSIRPAFAQHVHEGSVGKFYETWMRPDDRRVSCCNRNDCDRAQSRRGANGQWQSRHSDNEDWIDIPSSKIETERDSPDGQSHLCKIKTISGTNVYCFLPGSSG